MADIEVRAASALSLTSLGGLLVAGPTLLTVAGLWAVALYSGAIPTDVIEAITLWSLTVAIAALLIGRVVLRRRVAVMGEIAYQLRGLADGRTGVEIPATERMDELGELARATAFIRARLITLHKKLDDEEHEHAAHGMTSVRLVQSRSVLNETVTETTRINSGIRDHVSILSGQLGRLLNDTQATRETAAQGSLTLSELAVAVDQISRSVEEISIQAGQSGEMVRLASHAGVEVTAQVSQLAEAVRRVDSVVASIRAIAEQTNLLSLNATIEASRAGDAGRGFAVVAAEVKSLATETAKATTEITALVRSIQDVTVSAAHAASGISLRLEAVDGASRVITTAIGDQQAATREIARSSANAARHCQDTLQNFQAIEKVVLAASNTMTRLDDESERLASTTGRLETEFERLMVDLTRPRGSSSYQDAA